MAETSGAMNITAGIDLAQLNRDVQKMKAQLSEVGTHAAKEGQKLDGIAKKVAGSMAAMFSVAAAEQFGQKIFQVRSEFQQLEVAFKVLLKSEERAVKLMGELTNLAATTPFGLQEVSGTAKQLIAYGIAAEDVNETLTTLGNIASAVGAPLRDIAYLYGTTMVQGRMYTQDLRQFMGRGIALADKLAEHFGIATDQVQEYVTAGKVGAKEFKAAIDALGGAGGEYDGLMEEQSKTLQGQWSNLQDSLDMMLNEIGKTTQSAFGQAIGMASKLVENYEKIGRTIAAIVATYGAYKAATMAVTALEAIRATGIGRLTKMEALHYGWLVTTEKAQKLLNRTMLANPYVLIATAIVAAGAALVAYTRNAKSAADYTAELNETIESTGKVTQNDRLISEYETLKEKTQLTKDETSRMNEALSTLASSFPEAVTKANEWGEALEIDTEKLKALNDEYKALQMERFTEQIRENQEALKEIEREREFVAAAKKAYDAGKDRFTYNGVDYNAYKRYGGAKGAETLLKLKDEYDQINSNIRQAEKYVSILQGNYVEDPVAAADAEEEQAKTEKELRNSYNRRQRAKKAAEDLKKTKADLEIEIAEGEIEAMEEGYDKQRAAEEEARRAYLERYGNYEEKKKAIKDRYRKEMMAEGLKDYDIKMLEKEMEEELDALAQVYDEAYQKIFRDPSKMTKATILDTIELAKKKLLELDKEADPESFKALQEAINGLQDAYDNIDFGGWGSSWDEVLRKTVMISRYNDKIEKARKDGNKAAEEEAASNLESTKEALKKNIAGAGATLFADGLMQAASAMAEIAEISGDAHIREMSESLMQAGSVLSSVAQGAASGGPIGAIVAGATALMGQLVNYFTELAVAEARAKTVLKDYNKELELMRLSLDEDDFSGIFGDRTLAKAKEAYKLYNDAWKAYYGDNYKAYKYTKEKGFLSSSQSWMSTAAESLADTTVQMSKKDLRTLADVYPEIFNEDGSLKLAEAEAALANYAGEANGEYDTAYDALRKAVEQTKLINENIAILDGIISDYTQNMASSLSESIFDGILTGADAWDTFQDKGSEAILALGQQMLSELIMTEVLNNAEKDYQTRLRDALGSGDAESFAAIYAEMMNDLKSKSEIITSAGEDWMKMMEEQGYDLASAREATSKGIATASQDSVDELNGRATAIQSHTYSIMESGKAIAEDMSMLRSQAGSILSHVMGIHEDTGSMDGKLTRIQSAIEDIRDRGVNIKGV